MEWAAITSILREKNLLQPARNVVTMETPVYNFGLSKRVQRCLIRAGISNTRELMAYFANGAEDRWSKIRKVQTLGRKTFDSIVQWFSTCDFALEGSWCYVTTASPIEALDPTRETLQAFRSYQIKTVGQLYAACQDQNRFSGLRHLDNKLYIVATIYLSQYGFC